MAVQNLIVVDPRIVTRMADMLTRYSAEDIQDSFGISLNTWCKLRKGQGIRRSVAARLLGRLEPGLDQQAAIPAAWPEAWEVPQGVTSSHSVTA